MPHEEDAALIFKVALRQQEEENLLKTLIVLADQQPPLSHALDRLAQLAGAQLPEPHPPAAGGGGGADCRCGSEASGIAAAGLKRGHQRTTSLRWPIRRTRITSSLRCNSSTMRSLPTRNRRNPFKLPAQRRSSMSSRSVAMAWPMLSAP